MYMIGQVYYKKDSSKLSSSRIVIIGTQEEFLEVCIWNFFKNSWSNSKLMKKETLDKNYEVGK